MSTMDLAAFRASLKQSEPPNDASLPLSALWHDGRGDWNRAHEIAQECEEQDCAWVHAYLHRKEGDLSNAGYWYRKAGKTMHQGTVVEEWASLVQALLLAA